jgi:hypothetical protein
MSNKKAFRYTKSKTELEDDLRLQLANMRRSADAFDKGALGEAYRLAAIAYILCHDGSKNTSLLTQLAMKSGMRFPDTGSWPPKEEGVLTLDPPLLCLNMDDAGQLRYAAPLGDSARMDKIVFFRWWSQKVFISRQGRRSLTRQSLVFGMRNQDGGGHVDGELTGEAYYRFSRIGDYIAILPDKSLSGYAAKGADNKPLPNGHLFTMRQIAWELEQAIQFAGY